LQQLAVRFECSMPAFAPGRSNSSGDRSFVIRPARMMMEAVEIAC
jgi:hypothetical protein